MTRAVRCSILGGLLISGCKDATAPHQRHAPPLEGVQYALLGSGSKVAFQRFAFDNSTTAAVYIIDASTGTSTHILDDSSGLGPVLSPDGRRVAYSSWKIPTNYDVYVTNIDGSATQQLTNFPNSEGAPAWTPDGTAIVMPVTAAFASFNVFSKTLMPGGTGPTQWTSFTPKFSNGSAECPIIESLAIALSVSPQGELAFGCRGAIEVQTAGGPTAARYMTTPPPNAAGVPFVEAPSWSPDGSKLAFLEIRGDSLASSGLLSVVVRTTNADGSNPKTLADIVFKSAFNPAIVATKLWSICWMPDQTRLVFNVPNGVNTGSLWVVKADGTDLTRLTTAPNVFDGSVSCSR